MGLLGKLFGKTKSAPEELPPEFMEDSPPDWLIELKGQEMPDGSVFSVRAQLRKITRIGTADILILPRTDAEVPRSATTDLEKLDIDRLLVILGFSFPADIDDIAGETTSGLPVSLTIHRLAPYASRLATCNLAGWRDSKQPAPPVVEIANILVRTRDRAFPSRT